MNMKSLVLVLSAVALNGCTHSLMRGGVAMKVSENEAHVCLGDKEAKVGDRVTAFSNICTNKGGGKLRDGDIGVCEKRKLGGGTVIALLNEHYSLVRFDKGVNFDEGTFVEKR